MKDEALAEVRYSSFCLLCIFLILKLTNNINWSWWWVMAPLYVAPIFSGTMTYFILKLQKSNALKRIMETLRHENSDSVLPS